MEVSAEKIPERPETAIIVSDGNIEPKKEIVGDERVEGNVQALPTAPISEPDDNAQSAPPSGSENVEFVQLRPDPIAASDEKEVDPKTDVPPA